MKVGDFFMNGASSIEKLGKRDYLLRTRANNGELVYKQRLVGYSLKEAKKLLSQLWGASK